jgi:hypothetical protein
MGIFAVTLIVCGASLATAGIPDLEESEAVMAELAGGPYEGATLSLFCVPDGGGKDFTECFVKGGDTVTGLPVIVDATITLTLEDGGGFPVADYPAEDMWLQWTDETTMFICVGGTLADGDTDDAGQTEWQDAMFLGGQSEVLAQIIINGEALTSGGGFPLHVNSADIDYSGDVKLADVGPFAADYIAPVAPYRSDFSSDNDMNLADVGLMAQGVGAACP